MSRQLNDFIVPERAVKYWRQSGGAAQCTSSKHSSENKRFTARQSSAEDLYRD
jgi:hypothetical protein